MTHRPFDIRAPLALLPVKRFRDPPPVVTVLRLAGIIGGMERLRRRLDMAAMAAPIEAAFKHRNLCAVALVVNSPGGSPVQSALIARRIRSLAEEKEVPVFAFAEDVAASGGYWLACAADEIFAMESSLIGSIGVVTGGFGFPGMLKRLGVERRLHRSGERKAMLDPFLREDPDDVERLKAIQAEIHEGFKELVRERRGKRLKAPEEELFSGEFWTGGRALEMGLIDGIGDLRSVMRQRFGERVKLRPVGRRRSWWRRRFWPRNSMADAGPGDWPASILAAVEERLLWGRFGL